MTFIRLDKKDTIVTSEKVVKPAWFNDQSSLTTHFIETNPSSDFYTQVYAESPASNIDTPVQYSVAYGHKTGLGSSLTLSDGTKSSKIVYSQYRNLVYNSESGSFFFGDFTTSVGYTSDDILVISVSRDCFKESLKAGSVNISLKNGSNVLNLTDYSLGQRVNNYIGNNRYYHLVKGTNGAIDSGATINNTTNGSYGLVLPDKGLIILNPNALKLAYNANGIGLSIATTTTTKLSNNAINLINLIKAGSFGLRSEQTVFVKVIQATVNMEDCNYSTNPSFVDDKGIINFSDMYDNPEVYFTTVGLYNDQNELLAVVKLPNPIAKNFTTKPTIEIRLNW